MSQAGSSASAAPAPSTSDAVLLDQVVQEITTSKDRNALLNRISSLGSKTEIDRILSGPLSNGQDPLTVLDPERHTLGVLHILVARLNPSSPQPPSLIVIEEFCKRFSPEQARLAPDRVTALAKGIVAVATASSNLKYALTPLYDLLTRYPPSLSTLTTLHSHFLTTCVALRYFTAALPILSIAVTNVDTKLSDVTYNDNLVYHYSGGIALAALKRWKEAEEFFEICVTAPGTVPAAIQLEALKKLTLVQLIVYGKTISTPKYTNGVLTRLIKTSPYQNLVREFPSPREKLQKSVQKDADMYRNEKNWGLVQQVIDHAPRWLIKKLTSTYVTLGLADIAKEIGSTDVDEVRATIVSMIESGDISASISVNGTVTFSDITSTVTKAEIDEALRYAQAQTKLLIELERALTSSREYLTKALKHRDNDWAPDDEDGPGGPVAGFSWGDFL